eukprot:scaffold133358_cov89-Phaeocystis_antarctica.AAC.1
MYTHENAGCTHFDLCLKTCDAIHRTRRWTILSTPRAIHSLRALITLLSRLCRTWLSRANERTRPQPQPSEMPAQPRHVAGEDGRGTPPLEGRPLDDVLLHHVVGVPLGRVVAQRARVAVVHADAGELERAPREVGEAAATHDDPTAAAADGEGVHATHVAEAAAQEAHVAARADGDGAPRLAAVRRARRVLQDGRLDLDVPPGGGGLAGGAILEAHVVEGVAVQPARVEEQLLDGHPGILWRRRRAAAKPRAAKGAVEDGRARGVELAGARWPRDVLEEGAVGAGAL